MEKLALDDPKLVSTAKTMWNNPSPRMFCICDQKTFLGEKTITSTTVLLPGDIPVAELSITK